MVYALGGRGGASSNVRNPVQTETYYTILTRGETKITGTHPSSLNWWTNLFIWSVILLLTRMQLGVQEYQGDFRISLPSLKNSLPNLPHFSPSRYNTSPSAVFTFLKRQYTYGLAFVVQLSFVLFHWRVESNLVAVFFTKTTLAAEKITALPLFSSDHYYSFNFHMQFGYGVWISHETWPKCFWNIFSSESNYLYTIWD